MNTPIKEAKVNHPMDRELKQMDGKLNFFSLTTALFSPKYMNVF
jgi:hypothetical protein